MALDPVAGTAKLISIPPKEGNLVFFPAYLMHEVQTNNSNEVRISITFDLKLKDTNIKVTDKNVARTVVDNYERFLA
jgi:ectoine hydroxylase-related dioxygenase (phytanoyl-CoA dioxygenase family)